MTYEKRQKYAIFAKIAKMINMAKTGGENGKTDLKKVKVARQKCES